MRSRGIASLRDLARKSGVSVETTRQAVKGLRVPTPPTVAGLADALGIEASQVNRWVGYEGTDSNSPYQPPVESSRLNQRQRRALDELIRSMTLKAGESGATSTSPMNQAGDDADEVTQANRGRLEHGQQPVPVLAEERRRRDKGPAFGNRGLGDLDHENTGTLRPPPSREESDAAWETRNRGAEGRKKQDRDAEQDGNS